MQKSIQKSASILKKQFHIPNPYVTKFVDHLKETPESFLFSNHKSTFEYKVKRTFMAWYRHSYTNYDQDIRAVQSNVAKRHIKSLYNQHAQNFLDYCKIQHEQALFYRLLRK